MRRSVSRSRVGSRAAVGAAATRSADAAGAGEAALVGAAAGLAAGVAGLQARISRPTLSAASMVEENDARRRYPSDPVWRPSTSGSQWLAICQIFLSRA